MFNKIRSLFSKNKEPTTKTQIKLIQDIGNSLYMWDGVLYKSDVIRSILRPFATSIGKLEAKHIRQTKNDDIVINPEPYIRLLLEDPNENTSGQMLQEKITNQLMLNGNAFCYISRDHNGYAMAIYHIAATNVEAIYNAVGELYLRFTLTKGQIVEFSYQDVIHLRGDFISNDIFGNSNHDELRPLMDIVKTTDQSIVGAIKNSRIIKWLLKYTSSIRDEDLKKKGKDFSEQWLNNSIDDSTGVAVIDSKLDAQQVENKDYVPNAAIMDRTAKRILSYFNISEKIVMSTATEDEWNTFYELRLEPIVIQISKEFTRKLFTVKERAYGNKIIFAANNLQYASMSTKLNLANMVDRGSMTPNEWRAVMNLGPIEGGNKPIRRLDTAPVNGVGEGGKRNENN